MDIRVNRGLFFCVGGARGGWSIFDKDVAILDFQGFSFVFGEASDESLGLIGGHFGAYRVARVGQNPAEKELGTWG